MRKAEEVLRNATTTREVVLLMLLNRTPMDRHETRNSCTISYVCLMTIDFPVGDWIMCEHRIRVKSYDAKRIFLFTLTLDSTKLGQEIRP